MAYRFLQADARNDFDVCNLASNQSLKQVVTQPTRGNATLDLIVTNLHNLYNCPSIQAPLGSSDHNMVQWLPSSENNKQLPPVKYVRRQVRCYPRSGIDAFGRWITTFNWFEKLGPSPSVDELATSFTTQLTKAVDRIFPVKTLKSHQSDKPWITPEIKLMIKDRQKAFHSGNIPIWQSMKCKVQQEITERKKSFYKNKVKYLCKDDCRKWWNIVNKMSGRSERSTNFLLERDGKTMNEHELVKSLNEFYVSVNADIPPLEVNKLPAFLPANECIPTIQPTTFRHSRKPPPPLFS
jgi:hypothetical protein